MLCLEDSAFFSGHLCFIAPLAVGRECREFSCKLRFSHFARLVSDAFIGPQRGALLLHEQGRTFEGFPRHLYNTVQPVLSGETETG